MTPATFEARNQLTEREGEVSGREHGEGGRRRPGRGARESNAEQHDADERGPHNPHGRLLSGDDFAEFQAAYPSAPGASNGCPNILTARVRTKGGSRPAAGS